MPRIDVVAECEIPDSFRVQKIAGMFDVSVEEKSRVSWSVEIPGDDEEWDIGVIVGPSGSGKSSIAREVYGESLYTSSEWPKDKAVVDAFGDHDVRAITEMLTAVGFSSPPSWIKPYHVLSNGEKMRCDLAMALLSDHPVIAFDEFTSVVDRNVATIGSAAVAKSIRKGSIKRKFVAVTCHYDIIDWLEPSWVLDMADGSLSRRRHRRLSIELSIYRCERSAWGLFARHHYLDSKLATSCRNYLALLDGRPVGFCAAISYYGRKNWWRISRVVVLPDYQGIGIGSRLLKAIASHLKRNGNAVTMVAGNPAMVAHCVRSNDWIARRIDKMGVKSTGIASKTGHKTCEAMRSRVSFRYVGD